MKDKPKKKKKPTDKLSPSPVPPEWEELVPDSDVSLSDVLNASEDTMAVQVGNASYKVLVQRSKNGDDKSFFALIKIHTSAHPFDSKEDSKLIIPSLSANRDFYEQKWVQNKLKKGMENKQFRKDFWKAVFSNQNDTLYNRSASELKRYISIRKTIWEKEKMTAEDIEKELTAKNYIQEWHYKDIDSLRRFLNRLGLSRLPGRPRKAKNRT
jgi:hypothetical protein